MSNKFYNLLLEIYYSIWVDPLNRKQLESNRQELEYNHECRRNWEKRAFYYESLLEENNIPYIFPFPERS